MDFRQTNTGQSRPGNTTPATSPVSSTKKDSKNSTDSKWFRILNLVLLFAVAILIVGVALVFTRTGNDSEHKFVNTSRYQAVFLNNGQVYFGKVGALNDKYVQLQDVYYLTQSSDASGSSTSAANASYTLLKLGCQQIHYPDDQMLINRDQVTFWENLNDKGQVVTKINELKKQGVDCSKVTSQTQASSTGTSAQGTGTTSTGTSSTTKTGQ